MTFYRFNGHQGDFVTYEKLIAFNSLEDAMKDTPTEETQSHYSVAIVFEVDGVAYKGMPISLKKQVKARWTKEKGWLQPNYPEWNWNML